MPVVEADQGGEQVFAEEAAAEIVAMMAAAPTDCGLYQQLIYECSIASITSYPLKNRCEQD